MAASASLMVVFPAPNSPPHCRLIYELGQLLHASDADTNIQSESFMYVWQVNQSHHARVPPRASRPITCGGSPPWLGRLGGDC